PKSWQTLTPPKCFFTRQQQRESCIRYWRHSKQRSIPHLCLSSTNTSTHQLSVTSRVRANKMATDAPPNLLMVEGTFEDQIYELAAYIEGLKNVEPGSLANVLQPLVEKDDKEAVIKTLVDAASVLMKAPEKGLLASRLS